MKKHKKLTYIAVTVWALTCLLLNLPVAYAWGDNGGGRESHTIDEINSGILGDSIIFNTISDSVIGNEKNFVGARKVGDNGYWEGNEIDVEDGGEYLVRLYVHNNSPLGWDAVSENTRVAFNLPHPQDSGKQLEINGYIFSDNAEPSEYWDYVHFNSDHTFHLEYVYGSASIENNGFASQANGGGKPLSDEIVTAAASKNGIAIGYAALDGRIPGGYQYDCFIGIRVRVVYDYEFSVETGVRRADTDDWQDTITARTGDQLEFYINYTNTSDEPQKQVTVQNILPSSLSFLDGSITLQGIGMDSLPIDPDSLTGENICIGDFEAGESASIRFRAKVDNEGPLADGTTAVNWVRLRVGSTSEERYMAIEPVNTRYLAELVILSVLMILCLIVAARAGWYLWQNREMNKWHDRQS